MGEGGTDRKLAGRQWRITKRREGLTLAGIALRAGAEGRRPPHVCGRIGRRAVWLTACGSAPTGARLEPEIGWGTTLDAPHNIAQHVM